MWTFFRKFSSFRVLFHQNKNRIYWLFSWLFKNVKSRKPVISIDKITYKIWWWMSQLPIFIKFCYIISVFVWILPSQLKKFSQPINLEHFWLLWLTECDFSEQNDQLGYSRIRPKLEINKHSKIQSSRSASSHIESFVSGWLLFSYTGFVLLNLEKTHRSIPTKKKSPKTSNILTTKQL